MQKSAQEWNGFNYVLCMLVATNTGRLYLHHDDTQVSRLHNLHKLLQCYGYTK